MSRDPVLEMFRSPTLNTDIETRVYYDPEISSEHKSVADSKIEINLYQIWEDCDNIEEAVDEAISHWIDLRCVFLCGCMSSDATKFLVNAVHSDAELQSLFVEKAVRAMKSSLVWHKDYTDKKEDFVQALEEVEQ